ncbi:Chalcone-flavonone isomerase family protein [Rhynchospora pubera]|uniref:Chalcone-flavonone isomerase family protein n=1 Tax=Rhynchospora pubera TaxID=906938 RepID=A0AAV8I0P8_9POAL|nr:Chalcone-flavonone isomerase family protein [Rhynchospora pubera]
MVALVPKPTPLDVDGVAFPAFVTPPDSSKPPLFLAGAGVRGLDIAGRFVKFTAIAIYLQDSALDLLACKWTPHTNTPDQLASATDFFADIINGPFEKFIRVTMILPLTGEQYSEKVSENCVAHWKSIGIFTEAEANAVDKFKQVFKPETFPPGSSILFTHSPSGTLSIAFSKDDSVPETNMAVIENKALCRAVIESIIGEHGVSPAAKSSIAVRFCEHLKSQSAAQNQDNPVSINA